MPPPLFFFFFLFLLFPPPPPFFFFSYLFIYLSRGLPKDVVGHSTGSAAEVVVYLRNATTFTVDLSHTTGALTAHWFSPTTGRWLNTTAPVPARPVELTPPAGFDAPDLDVALLLKA